MTFEVRIERLSRKGRGVGLCKKSADATPARVDVVGAVPGDVVLVTLGAKRKGKYSGEIQQIIDPSPDRVLPECSHAPLCGGCSLQPMRYVAQLQMKEAKIRHLFSTMASNEVFQPILLCKDLLAYRNKMEFSFSQNRAGEFFLGLMIAGSKGKVLDLKECLIVSPWFSEVLKAVRHWWQQSGLQAYRMNDTGSLRTLTVREGKRSGDKLVMLTVSGNPDYAIPRSQLDRWVEAVLETVPSEERERVSLFLRIHQIQKGVPTQFYELSLHGPDHIMEHLHLGRSFSFKISPTSFFQPNTDQAERWYQLVLEGIEALAEGNLANHHIFDLYAGTATLGLMLASRAKRVTAIELNPHAIFDAESNKERNGIENIDLICGDVGEVLDRKFAEPSFVFPEGVIVDPPRAGLDPKAMKQLLRLKPKYIVYVSCNPETQALNVQELLQAGYEVVRIQPVDQFPHTIHVENIAFLRHAGSDRQLSV